MKIAVALTASLLLTTPAAAWGTDPQQRVAVIWAAVSFASVHCPDFAVSYGRRNAALANEGALEVDAQNERPLIDLWVRFFLKQRPRACDLIESQFGPAGTHVPGLVARIR